MKTCAFTGHRPQHLPFGMNENDERCADLKETLRLCQVKFVKRAPEK